MARCGCEGLPTATSSLANAQARYVGGAVAERVHVLVELYQHPGLQGLFTGRRRMSIRSMSTYGMATLPYSAYAVRCHHLCPARLAQYQLRHDCLHVAQPQCDHDGRRCRHCRVCAHLVDEPRCQQSSPSVSPVVLTVMVGAHAVRYSGYLLRLTVHSSLGVGPLRVAQPVAGVDDDSPRWSSTSPLAPSAAALPQRIVRHNADAG